MRGGIVAPDLARSVGPGSVPGGKLPVPPVARERPAAPTLPVARERPAAPILPVARERPATREHWMGFRAVDRAIVITQVSDVLAAGASSLTPAEVLTAVCEAAAGYLSLGHAVLFKRLAGQSRTLVWSAPGVTAGSRMAAREQAWTSAAGLFEDVAPLAGARGQVASATVWDERLGLSAMLYIESTRVLDAQDHRLLEDLLRSMLCLPGEDD